MWLRFDNHFINLDHFRTVDIQDGKAVFHSADPSLGPDIVDLRIAFDGSSMSGDMLSFVLEKAP